MLKTKIKTIKQYKVKFIYKTKDEKKTRRKNTRLKSARQEFYLN